MNMKNRMAMLLLVLVAPIALASGVHQHQAVNCPAFDQMKSLIGDWQATVPNLGVVTASYSLHSDGSALLETLKMPDGVSMITVYYPAGRNLAMTHYCSGHNQPHMTANGADPQVLEFAATSVDNLLSKDAEHMEGVTFTFKDSDHFTAAWTNVGGGKSNTIPFEFARTK